jgi:Holliday junction DNA helicase RuvB
MQHLGLFGKSGMGKTMLAHIIAEETDSELICINATAIKEPAAFLVEIYKAKKAPEQHYIIFVDEAHNLPRIIQENLLSALEEPAILCVIATPSLKKHLPNDVVTGQTVRVKLPKNISFIFGTTHKGALRDTVINRLVSIDLDVYSVDNYIKILKMTASKSLPEHIYVSLAGIGKNIRLMKRYLKDFQAYLDMIEVLDHQINKQHFHEFCDINGIGDDGCDKTDRKYMYLLHKHDKIGFKSLVAMLQVSEAEVANIVEPWLLEKEYIRITPRGRELTAEGAQRIGETLETTVTDVFDVID